MFDAMGRFQLVMQENPRKISADADAHLHARIRLCLMSLGFRRHESRVCTERGDRSNQAVLPSGSGSQIPPLMHP